jgi:carbonic anhydrase
MDCDEALLRLVAGNGRFVRGELIHPHEGEEWRRHLSHDQRPFATILGCSDSIVPPELVFDQGLGDLFVVRVAGNVIATDVLGSIQYAATHLSTQLFIVLGHEGCGVVKAALEEKSGISRHLRWIEGLMRLMLAGLTDTDAKLNFQQQLSAAVEANVRWSLKQLNSMPEAKRALREKRAKFVGAVYEPRSGLVRFLD